MLTITNKKSEHLTQQAAITFCVLVLIIFTSWGVAGYFSGKSFLESGLASLKIMVKTIPVILKAML